MTAWMPLGGGIERRQLDDDVDECPITGTATVARRVDAVAGKGEVVYGRPEFARADPQIHVDPSVLADQVLLTLLETRYLIGEPCPRDPEQRHARHPEIARRLVVERVRELSEAIPSLPPGQTGMRAVYGALRAILTLVGDDPDAESAPTIAQVAVTSCRHDESLYGRCTACGLTWEQQAAEHEPPG